MGCVEVCPVDCIYELKGEPSAELPNMLYIHPTACINCGACEPECPWQAIYEDQEMLPGTEADIELNARCEHEPELFQVAKMQRNDAGDVIRKAVPSPAQVKANKERHGL